MAASSRLISGNIYNPLVGVFVRCRIVSNSNVVVQNTLNSVAIERHNQFPLYIIYYLFFLSRVVTFIASPGVIICNVRIQKLNLIQAFQTNSDNNQRDWVLRHFSITCFFVFKPFMVFKAFILRVPSSQSLYFTPIVYLIIPQNEFDHSVVHSSDRISAIYRDAIKSIEKRY